MMKMNDFKVLKCEKCGNTSILYAPPLSNNPELRKMELEEYKTDFEVEISDDFKFTDNCDRCGEARKEIPLEDCDASIFSEILGNLLEDDNRHSVVSIGSLIIKIMNDIGINEKDKQQFMYKFLEHYNETHSLNY